MGEVIKKCCKRKQIVSKNEINKKFQGSNIYISSRQGTRAIAVFLANVSCRLSAASTV